MSAQLRSNVSTLRMGPRASCLHARNPRDGTFGHRYSFTTVNELAMLHIDPPEMNWENPTVLLLMGVCYKNAKVSQEGLSYYSRGRRNEGSVNYDRLLHCYDPFATDGENMIDVCIGRGHNVSFYSKCLNDRDSNIMSEFCVV